MRAAATNGIRNRAMRRDRLTFLKDGGVIPHH